MGVEFQLHPRLQADSDAIAELALCSLRLLADARFPWVLLVPRLPQLRELHDVPPAYRAQLWNEVEQASRALQKLYCPDKLNVGTLGNLVPQLHIHVVARYEHDPAWPGPVWGAGTAEPYSPQQRQLRLDQLRWAMQSAAPTQETP